MTYWRAIWVCNIQELELRIGVIKTIVSRGNSQSGNWFFRGTCEPNREFTVLQQKLVVQRQKLINTTLVNFFLFLWPTIKYQNEARRSIWSCSKGERRSIKSTDERTMATSTTRYLVDYIFLRFTTYSLLVFILCNVGSSISWSKVVRLSYGYSLK